MDHALRCRCGTLRGVVSSEPGCTRLVCYCKDCQAFAHFLGDPGDILDAQGGTDVLAVRPQQLRFTAGLDKLACMSLSPKGLLRWYASCCNTPIGNTGRDFRLAHVGLVHTCLDTGRTGADDAFGPVRYRAMRNSAKGEVAGVGIAAIGPLAGLVWGLLRARLNGSYRCTPLFKPDGTPVAVPTVLTLEQRSKL